MAERKDEDVSRGATPRGSAEDENPSQAQAPSDDNQSDLRSAEDRPDDELPVEGDEDYVPVSQNQDEPFLQSGQQAELDERNEAAERGDDSND